MLQRVFRARIGRGFLAGLCLGALLLAGAKTGLALDPDAILVVANRKAARSVGHAVHEHQTANILSVFQLPAHRLDQLLIILLAAASFRIRDPDLQQILLGNIALVHVVFGKPHTPPSLPVGDDKYGIRV